MGCRSFGNNGAGECLPWSLSTERPDPLFLSTTIDEIGARVRLQVLWEGTA